MNNIEKLIDTTERLSKKEFDYSGAVLYQREQRTILSFCDDEVYLCSIQSKSENSVSANFMVAGKKIMYCFDSRVTETTIKESKYGGIEYHYTPFTDEVTDYCLTKLMS